MFCMLTRHLSQGLPQVGILPPQTADNRSLLRFEPFSEEPLWLISGRGHLNHLLPNITRDSTKKRYILGVAKYMISKINIQNGSIFVFFQLLLSAKCRMVNTLNWTKALLLIAVQRRGKPSCNCIYDIKRAHK